MKREVRAVTRADQRSLCPRQELPGVLLELAADAPRTLPTCGVPFPLHNWVLSLGRICKPLLSSDALRPNCTARFIRAVIHLVYQWLSTNGKSKNTAVVQSSRVDASAGLQNKTDSRRSRPYNQRRDELGRVRARRSRQSLRASFLHVLCTGRHQKARPRFKVAIPTSEDLDLALVFPLQMT
ncbi:hypothetical protein STEG23_034228 [Scotinomys teguina]